MATVPSPLRELSNGYPTSDGKPMAETDLHRDLMTVLIETLRDFFAAQPQVYVSGNLLLFYEQGNRRKHVSPDVFVVRGVANHQRINYLLWEEGHPPNVVIELTSSSTKNEDTRKKLALYRDVLKVREYFLFDPMGDYLDPRLQGHRLWRGEYRPVPLVEGRLPSRELGLHLEQGGNVLRLWSPETHAWLPTRLEAVQQAEERNAQLQAQVQRLQQQLHALQQPPPA